MATETPTPTPTITPSVTLTPTITPSVTTTNTPTPSITTTRTPTPSITTTITPTQTQTQTNTPSHTPTQTPSETPYGTFQANLYYEYGTGQTGSFSGGTWNESLGPVPHPISYANLKQDGKKGTVYQMNVITIGGFGGLNN